MYVNIVYNSLNKCLQALYIKSKKRTYSNQNQHKNKNKKHKEAFYGFPYVFV